MKIMFIFLYNICFKSNEMSIIKNFDNINRFHIDTNVIKIINKIKYILSYIQTLFKNKIKYYF